MLGRYALPVLLARSLIEERLGNLDGGARLAVILTAVKILCLASVLIGIGYVSALSNVYLEAVQEAGIFLLLLAGFVPAAPRLDRRPHDPAEVRPKAAEPRVGAPLPL